MNSSMKVVHAHIHIYICACIYVYVCTCIYIILAQTIQAIDHGSQLLGAELMLPGIQLWVPHTYPCFY